MTPASGRNKVSPTCVMEGKWVDTALIAVNSKCSNVIDTTNVRDVVIPTYLYRSVFRYPLSLFHSTIPEVG